MRIVETYLEKNEIQTFLKKSFDFALYFKKKKRKRKISILIRMKEIENDLIVGKIENGKENDDGRGFDIFYYFIFIIIKF